ncbi:hypothetical protein DPMN_001577 [Dreissena polymorpha]|uniref:Uncharacterized protein n=1 Tax=Dreissena polymorpha TaxID=45954 RepID=A0A9D4MK24_DREPO|nr:hypothetical protein DPMN_001577 [Dreissena polymorpha]
MSGKRSSWYTRFSPKRPGFNPRDWIHVSFIGGHHTGLVGLPEYSGFSSQSQNHTNI